MQMLSREIRKIFFRQNVFVIILVFLLIKGLCVWYSVYNDRPDIPQGYNDYLTTLGGKLDHDKEEYIKNRYDELNDVVENINDLEEQYESGNISRKVYLKELGQLARLKQEQREIKQFYKKYEYAKENPQKHYIIDEYGWDKLLTEEHIDYLFLTLVFLMVIPIFCYEYETEMNYLQLCSRNGRYRLTVMKLFVVSFTTMILKVLFSVWELLVYKHVYGLSSCSAPIQSLPFFEESSYSLSLMGLWKLITMTQVVGAVFLCLMIMVVSIMVKKSILSIIINALLVFIPCIFSGAEKLKYILPLPTGLLYGNGYFFTDIISYRLDEEMNIEKYVSFQAFSKQQLYMLAVLYGLIICLLIGFIMYRYVNTRINVQNKIRRRKVVSLLSVVCIILTMTGCSFQDWEGEEIFYEDSYSSSVFITDRYYFSLDANNILAQDLQTGEKFQVLRNVFEHDEQNMDFKLSMFVTERYLYYLKDYDSELQIYRVDLDDFSEKCLYVHSKDDKGNTETFYDLLMVTEKYFFLNDSSDERTIYINRRSGKWKTFDASSAITLGNGGNTVYYENSNSQIEAFRLDEDKKTVYEDIALRSYYSVKDSSFYINNGYCYYTNMLDKDYVYRYCFDTGENTLLLQQNSIKVFWSNSRYFYYMDLENKIYQMDLKTNKQEVVDEGTHAGFEMNVDGSSLYIEILNDNGESEWKKIVSNLMLIPPIPRENSVNSLKHT